MNIRKHKFIYPLLFVVLLSALLMTFLLNVGLGSVKIGVNEVAKIILQKTSDNQVHQAIVWKIRLPRTIATILGGASLAVAGLLLQIFFRNPIVGPFVLGISSGATLFVGVVILAGVNFGLGSITPYVIFLSAFIGSLVVMGIVLIVARKVKNIVTLLVVGLMVGYLCSAVTNLLMAFAEKEQVQGFVMWTLGSFSGFTWVQVKVLALAVIPALLGTFLMCKPLNALLLGEKYAQSMGVSIKIYRYLIILLSGILASVVTAFAGPVAFIGLAVPHIARLSFGTSDNRILIPATILLGAIITGICDLFARLLYAPIELPISSVTSFIGAPIVIFLLLRRKNAL